MNLGSKYGLDFIYNCDKNFKSFEEDIDIFVLKLVYKHALPIEDFLKWKLEICNVLTYFNKNAQTCFIY